MSGQKSIEQLILEHITKNQSSPGNYVRVDQLKKEIGVDSKTFDHAALHLMEQGKIISAAYEGPTHKLSRKTIEHDYVEDVDSHDRRYLIGLAIPRMKRTLANPGYGKAFTFHGSFVSLILARRREREIPGSFIHQHKGRYYVLKPKKMRTNPRRHFGKRIKHPYCSHCGIRHAGTHIQYIEKREKRKLKLKPNPRTGTLIYGRVLKIFAQKTSGPFKGQRFVHAFKAGALMYGMPDGSLKIIHK